MADLKICYPIILKNIITLKSTLIRKRQFHITSTMFPKNTFPIICTNNL